MRLESGKKVVFSTSAPGRMAWKMPGFFGFAEVDAFGIAPAFEIKDGAGGPAVFVVADQAAVGVGAERGSCRCR